MDETLTAWLLNEPEPWAQYRTRVDLLEMNESEPEVQNARQAMIDHPLVRSVAADAAAWGHDPVTRHNDAGHALHKLSLLADFGLTRDDPKMAALIERILCRQASQGAFLSPIQIPMAFGGTGVPDWSWIACDAPTLLYVLLSMGCKDDPRLGKAVQHLVGQGGETGWLCAAAPELGKFRGPGRKLDPCPYATLIALKALSLLPDWIDSPQAHAGAQVLLTHWEHRASTRYYLFAMGTDFRKVKYPYVWFDLLHTVEVLSRYPFVFGDPRFWEMVEVLHLQADGQGRYTAGSMYRSWQGFSFADKKNPSPWLTFLVLRILRRVGLA